MKTKQKKIFHQFLNEILINKLINEFSELSDFNFPDRFKRL